MKYNEVNANKFSFANSLNSYIEETLKKTQQQQQQKCYLQFYVSILELSIIEPIDLNWHFAFPCFFSAFFFLYIFQDLYLIVYSYHFIS